MAGACVFAGLNSADVKADPFCLNAAPFLPAPELAVTFLPTHAPREILPRSSANARMKALTPASRSAAHLLLHPADGSMSALPNSPGSNFMPQGLCTDKSPSLERLSETRPFDKPAHVFGAFCGATPVKCSEQFPAHGLYPGQACEISEVPLLFTPSPSTNQSIRIPFHPRLRRGN